MDFNDVREIEFAVMSVVVGWSLGAKAHSQIVCCGTAEAVPSQDQILYEKPGGTKKTSVFAKCQLLNANCCTYATHLHSLRIRTPAI